MLKNIHMFVLPVAIFVLCLLLMVLTACAAPSSVYYKEAAASPPSALWGCALPPPNPAYELLRCRQEEDRFIQCVYRHVLAGTVYEVAVGNDELCTEWRVLDWRIVQ